DVPAAAGRADAAAEPARRARAPVGVAAAVERTSRIRSGSDPSTFPAPAGRADAAAEPPAGRASAGPRPPLWRERHAFVRGLTPRRSRRRPPEPTRRRRSHRTARPPRLRREGHAFVRGLTPE